MSTPLIDDTRKKMDKTIEAFQQDMSKLRTGRASLAILDGVKVDNYGQLMPLNQVATLGIPDARLITIAPWDSSMISAIERAIDKAQIGISPVNDGKLIRLPIPPLNEERRKDLVRKVKVHAEESRVAIRHVRRETLEAAKKIEKDGKMTEDDFKKTEKQVQGLTDDFVAKIEQMIVKKEAEIMQI